jgi:hypothetical protein
MKTHCFVWPLAVLALAGTLVLGGCASKRIESANSSVLEEESVTSPTPPRRQARVAAKASKELSEDQTKILQDVLASLPEGLVTFDPPPALRIGVPVRFEARIARDFISKLTVALEATGKFTQLQAKSFVGLQLTGDGFTMLAAGPEEQPVGDQNFTSWAWNAVPNKAGRSSLALTATLRLLLNGAEQKRAYPMLERWVDVQEPQEGFFKTYGWWILAILLVAAAVFLLLKKS